MTLSHLRLGASLYVPATRGDIVAVANGSRYPGLRSVILCTEDSILPGQVHGALETLRRDLPRIEATGPSVFIRPRDWGTLERILSLPGIDRVDGFVLPKATEESIAAHAAVIPDRFSLMPTLETREVFDTAAMVRLRDRLSAPELRERILALRIGGNDLLNLLGVRRRPGRTIYETALGPVIASLVAIFRPHGFPLTAPVFDDFGDVDCLNEEVLRDLDHGLIGKTAIHPLQIAGIERHYWVRQSELEAAEAILAEDAPGVFQIDRVMFEPATHARWARTIVERARIYGTITLDDDAFLSREIAAL
jgi:citrate lyase beta subunit